MVPQPQHGALPKDRSVLASFEGWQQQLPMEQLCLKATGPASSKAPKRAVVRIFEIFATIFTKYYLFLISKVP